MISVEGITKYYGEKCALDNVSFKVEKGETIKNICKQLVHKYEEYKC